MLICKPTSTPVDMKAKVSAVEGSPTSDAPFYRSIIGALQYLTLMRPSMLFSRCAFTCTPPVTLIGLW